MKLVLIYAVLGMLSVMVGCSSEPESRYLDVRSSAHLAIPPDLTQDTRSEKFEIPASFSSGTGESVNQVPVLAQVDSLRLEGREDFYWLTVDGSIENLYQLTKAFWASEGFVIAVDEPVIGMMQTEWVFKEEGAGKGDAGFFEKLFLSDDLSASQDQYRTRIARDVGTNKTQIYISHRGTSYKHEISTRRTEDDEPNKWSFRPREPELEVEMLSRLMIFLGLKKHDVDQQLADIKLFAPRSSIHIDNAENTTYLLVRSAKQQTWNRILNELDRLNIEIISTNYSVGFLDDGEIVIKSDFQIETKKGGFFSFFSDETEIINIEMRLVMLEETHELTRVSIETPEGDVDVSPEAAEFLTMLHKRIK